jgi:hypothetical protein
MTILRQRLAEQLLAVLPLLLLLGSTSFIEPALAQVVSYCGSEADDLSNCVAVVGGSSSDITPCLNCVADALKAAAEAAVASSSASSSSPCKRYNATYCTSIFSDCSGTCDDATCGAEFTSYYDCQGQNAYRQLNTTEILQGGACEIDCGGGDIVRNGTDAGGSNGGAGNETTVGGACNATWTDLEQCLAGQGRSDESRLQCGSCVAESIPPLGGGSASCSSLNEQFCTAVASCANPCASKVCAEPFGRHVRCAGQSASGSGTNSCPSTSCGLGQTSAAAAAETASLLAALVLIVAALVTM